MKSPVATVLFLCLAPLAAQQSSSMLVKTRGPLTAAVVDALAAAYGTRVTYTWPQISTFAVDVPERNLAALTADPRVARVERDGPVPLPAARAVELAGGAAAPAGLAPSTSWNQDAVDTLDSGLDGDGVTVVVLDTGLPQNWRDVLPPDIRLDLVHQASFAPEGNGLGLRNYVNTSPNAYIGLHTHGLGVTGVMSGFRRLPGLEFVRGAAERATFLPLRLFGQKGVAQFSWMTHAFLYIAELKRSGALTGPVVVNYSVQSFFNAAYDEAIDYMLAQGVLLVVAAGNQGDAGVTFPASKPESISVGATGFVGELATPLWYLEDVPENDPFAHYVAGFSSRELAGVPTASQIDVLGPGSYAISAWGFGNGITNTGFAEGRGPFRLGIAYLFGTSFAAPHVVGVVAQMLQRNPTLTQAQAEAILRGSALPIPTNATGLVMPEQFVPPWGVNATGAGLLRGGAAVAATPGL